MVNKSSVDRYFFNGTIFDRHHFKFSSTQLSSKINGKIILTNIYIYIDNNTYISLSNHLVFHLIIHKTKEII